jgi:cell wall integrity and stress response component
MGNTNNIDSGGGATVWSVFLTGFTLNQVQNYDPSSASSSTMTVAPSMTASTSSSSSKKSSSPVGIVVGVIVGIVIVGALAGAGFIFLRRRQKQEVDELKKQNDLPAFVGAKVDQARPQMWAPDSRLDNDASGRRVSNGSIADNQDFSRRILQVNSDYYQFILTSRLTIL